MRARAFFYGCAGILLLVIAYSVGARAAGAGSIPNPESYVVGLSAAHPAIPQGVVLRSDGAVFQFDPTGISPTAEPAPPVPVSEIALWQGRSVVTKTGHIFAWENETTGWRDLGAVPVSVGVSAKSWSDAKQGYRK